jgi:hypothetical protein
LEADRERFSDLQGVYAFDAVDGDSAQADDRWAAIAVHPLPYLRGAKGAVDRHAALWRDLSRLADLVDRPKAWRRAHAEAILSKTFGAAGPDILNELAWLVRDKRDLWDVAIAHTSDPRWFDHFTEQKLWNDADAANVLAAWCSHNWNDTTRLGAAVAWHARFKNAFGQALEARLNSPTNVAPPGPLFGRAWRLLVRDCQPPRETLIPSYLLSRRIRSGDCSDSELRDAVRLLRPRIEVVPTLTGTGNSDSGSRAPTWLSDLFHVRMTVGDSSNLGEIKAALREVPDRATRLLEIATEELRITIELAHEAQLIGPSWDYIDSGVPAVEDHSQNEYHDGAVLLVTTLTNLLELAAAKDPTRARTSAEIWRQLPSRIGARLWLHSLRRAELYSAKEAATALLSLSKDAFWSIRRELALAMSERLSGAGCDQIALISQRILDEASSLYNEFQEIEEGQTDWRPQARDRDVWLRLAALRRAGALPMAAEAEINSIANRHPFIVGDFTEEDLFSSYMSRVTTIEADPTPLLSADPGNRLTVAKQLDATWSPSKGRSWSAYCTADPVGAFEALRQTALEEADAELWADLIGSLTWQSGPEADSKKLQRQELIRSVLDRLEVAGEPLLRRVSARIVDLLPIARRAGITTCDTWWDRLWDIIEREDDVINHEGGERFFGQVINRPPGRLAEQLLATISQRKKDSRQVCPDDRARLRRILDSDSKAGWLARGVLTRDAAFVLYLDKAGAGKSLRRWLARDDPQGKTLRAVLVELSRLGAVATRTYKKELIRGVLESHASGNLATT